jgi:hypothetical protein
MSTTPDFVLLLVGLLVGALGSPALPEECSLAENRVIGSSSIGIVEDVTNAARERSTILFGWSFSIVFNGRSGTAQFTSFSTAPIYPVLRHGTCLPHPPTQHLPCPPTQFQFTPSLRPPPTAAPSSANTAPLPPPKHPVSANSTPSSTNSTSPTHASNWAQPPLRPCSTKATYCGSKYTQHGAMQHQTPSR